MADSNVFFDENDSESSTVQEHDYLVSFIEQYEMLPELWNPTHPKYSYKTARNMALDRLLPVMKKMKPTANSREEVKKKINSLRTNFRKELKKIATSKRSGKGTDEIYEPTSWVFHALLFLENFEKPAQQQPIPAATLSEALENQDKVQIQETEDSPQTVSGYAASCSSIQPPTLPISHITKKLRTQGPLAKQNLLLEKACTHLQAPCVDSNLPAIARAWGEKLMSLESKQRIFAEKAINDILFEASLGTLHRNSVHINVVQQYINSSYTSDNTSSLSTIHDHTPSPCYTPSPLSHTVIDPDRSIDTSITELFTKFNG